MGFSTYPEATVTYTPPRSIPTTARAWSGKTSGAETPVSCATDCKFNTTGTGLNYDEMGGPLTGIGQYGCNRTHFIRKDNKEKTGDWNTWEIFVKGDSLEVKVNGS